MQASVTTGRKIETRRVRGNAGRERRTGTSPSGSSRRGRVNKFRKPFTSCVIQRSGSGYLPRHDDENWFSTCPTFRGRSSIGHGRPPRRGRADRRYDCRLARRRGTRWVCGPRWRWLRGCRSGWCGGDGAGCRRRGRSGWCGCGGAGCWCAGRSRWCGCGGAGCRRAGRSRWCVGECAGCWSAGRTGRRWCVRSWLLRRRRRITPTRHR